MKADGRAWKADTLDAAPRAVRDGYRMMEYWLARQANQPLPRLIEVRRVPAGSTYDDYVFEIEHGLTIAMWRGPADTGSSFWRTTVDNVFVANCLAPLIKPQADRYLRELGERIDAAREQGFSVRLLRMDLEGLEAWRNPRQASFTAGIELLGTHLRPCIDRISFEAPSDLDAQFEVALGDQPSRHKLLAELGRNGADGMIDDIAMQMIMKGPAPDDIIRRLGGAAEVGLPGGTRLIWHEGVVTSLGKSRDARFRWKHNVVTLSVPIPEAVCAAAQDQPVTRLVEHPALSDGMIVRRISSPAYADGTETTIELELPLHYINTEEGTHWPGAGSWRVFAASPKIETSRAFSIFISLDVAAPRPCGRFCNRWLGAFWPVSYVRTAFRYKGLPRYPETGSTPAKLGPRNHLNLRSARPSGGGAFVIERNRKNSSQIAANVDLKLAFLRSQDDLSHQRADHVRGDHPLLLRILLKRRIQLVDLDVIVMRHVGMQVRSIERDLEDGHAAVVQVVSTGEALMERRLTEIPTEEWNDVRVDITPREYVLDYLAHSFPVQLYEPYTDGEGNLSSRPVTRDGQPVESREAVARRDELIERLASLPPVPGALDQIVQRFGTDMVAEVTGRSRCIVRKGERFVVENRAPSANLAETAAFMDDVKRVLVFSDAGGTGRSYHAELSAREPAPARPLPAGAGLEGRRRHSGSRPTGRTRRSRPCSARSQPT